MKIVLAPNAFKDSLTAIQASEAMALGIRRVLPHANIRQVPVADGGDGLTEIVLHAMHGENRTCEVKDPLGRKIKAAFCYLPEKQVAIIEMAEASGLRLLSSAERNPMLTSTIGTGQAIAAALELGATKILVGLGGSATCDGGIGMAAALGVKFFDDKNRLLDPVGQNLRHIHHIDKSQLDYRVKKVAFEAICDVNNPLLGKKGAAEVYAPQKGASPAQVKELETGLANLADRIEESYSLDVRTLDFGGAAGGLGAGIHSFLGAKLRPGVEIVLDLVELEAALEQADLVITGEGRLDEQTAFGKAPAGVALKALKMGVPCFAIAGSLGENISNLHQMGITAIFSICSRPLTLQQAMEKAEILLISTTEQAVRAFMALPNS